MYRRRFILFGVLIYIAGCGFEAVPKAQLAADKDTVGVIYGEDSVSNVSTLIPNSKVSVAFIPKAAFSRFTKKQPVETVGDKVGYIDEIKWVDDPSLAKCSGVLLEKDLVLTAGHCFEGLGSCSDLNVVFGFESSPAVLKTIKSVGCKEVIRHKDELIDKGLDYALVRLASDVNIPVVTIAKKEAGVGDDVYALGYPLGSPKKKSDGKIRKVLAEPGLYNSNLDVYQGNSGSPVFSSETNELIGIISAGESDFDDIPNLESTDPKAPHDIKVKHCADDECLGEIIIPIQKILADIDK